jgi:pimeloyl-ACP methyl ester carboxylesterase
MDLVYDRRGSGEPLVLLHGIGDRWQTWSPVLDLLAAEHDVIAVDLPGFGASPPLPPGSAYDLDDFVAAVEGFCADLGVERPHVAGNSLGGMIALELGRRGSARTVTALSPAGFWNGPEIAYATAALRFTRAVARSSPPGLAARVLGTRAGRAAMTGLIYGRPGSYDPDALIAGADALANAAGFAQTLAHGLRVRYHATITVPVTIAWGTRDRLLLPWQAARANRAVPGVRGVWLPGCGHVPMGDDPAMVAKVILEGARG